MQLNVNANGEGLGEGTHLSVFVFIMPGEYDDSLEWPLDHIVTIQLLNWSADFRHIEKTVNYHRASDSYRKRVFDKVRGAGYGKTKFMIHSELESYSDNFKKYMNENQLCFRITEVVKVT